MNEADRYNGVVSVVGGDPERARQLRANIAILARRLGDPQITRMVNEVLAGHRNVREVFRTRQFQEVGSRNLDNLEQGLDRLPAGERERMLVEAGERAEAVAEREERDARLHALRDRDLPSSPVGPTGDVGPDEDRRSWSR
jgi:hypothetical protein